MKARQTGDPMANTTPPAKSGANTSLLIRGAIWIAIGALIAAALVCVVWVLIGDQQGLIGRAFLTILLLAGFAAIAILEASLAPNREDWLALLSMISWILALLVGAVKIWLPDDGTSFSYFDGPERFFQLVAVVVILQLALLHVRLFRKAAARYVTGFTRAIVWATFAFLAVLVGMLVFYLTFPHTFHYHELYWRIVVALTILVAVGTMLIPLLNVLFAPKRPAPAPYAATASPAAPLQPWPTHADARTPLPILPDGSPDWNAYYTGVPSPGATIPGQVQAVPVQPAATQPVPAAAQPVPAAAQPAPVHDPLSGGHGLDGAAPSGVAQAGEPSGFPQAPPAPPTTSSSAS
ncbi:hypothetical protein [Microbacterium sp. 8M]|uniref:hypothetical protein n=1 Tax=Microbacterium sp. 8M TaxID=2653153 RepID=UPI001357BEB2|nr:hypothetical protein [Microbacterium sp. 8M]